MSDDLPVISLDTPTTPPATQAEGGVVTAPTPKEGPPVAEAPVAGDPAQRATVVNRGSEDIGLELTEPRTAQHKHSSFAEAVEEGLRKAREANKAPVEETPAEEPPAEAPKEEAPKEEAPKEEAPKEEAPKEEAPKDEQAPKEEAKEKDGEAERDPTEDLPDAEEFTDWTPKASKRFIALKAENKGLKDTVEQKEAQIATYERQMEELKGSLHTESLEDLQTKLAEFEQRQSFFDLENTDAYITAVTKPIQEQLGVLELVAEKHNLDGDALTELVGQIADSESGVDEDGISLDSKLEDLIEVAPLRDKTRVMRATEEIVSLLGRRAEMYQNANEAYQEAQLLEEQHRAKAAAEAAEGRREATASVVNRLTSKLPFLAGLEGMNLEDLQKEVGDIDPATQHPVDAQYQVAVSKMFPFVARDYLAQQAEIEALTERLSAYEKAEPGAAPPSNPTTPRQPAQGIRPPGVEALGDGDDFAGSVEKALSAAGFGGI